MQLCSVPRQLWLSCCVNRYREFLLLQHPLMLCNTWIQRCGFSSNRYEKDLYQKLGVSKSATHSEIRQAYLKAAKEHHPDITGQVDRQSRRIFHDISEAYEVLGNRSKRSEYDRGQKKYITDLRYTGGVQIWNAEKGRYESVMSAYKQAKSDPIPNTRMDETPTTQAEFLTFLYCGVVFVFAWYVLLACMVFW